MSFISYKKISVLLFVIFFGILLFSPVFAGSGLISSGLDTTVKGVNVAGAPKAGRFGDKNALITYVARITRAVLGVVGIIAMLGVIVAGFMFLTSAGNPEKVKKSTQMLLYGGIGLVIIFGAYTLTGFLVDKITSAG